MDMVETVAEWIESAPVGLYVAFDERGVSTLVEVRNDFFGVQTAAFGDHKVVVVGRASGTL